MTPSSSPSLPTLSTSSPPSPVCGVLRSSVVVLSSSGVPLGCACASSSSLSSVSPSPSRTLPARRLSSPSCACTSPVSPLPGVPLLGSSPVKSSPSTFVPRPCPFPSPPTGSGISVSVTLPLTSSTRVPETPASVSRSSSFGVPLACAVSSSPSSVCPRFVFSPFYYLNRSILTFLFSFPDQGSLAGADRSPLPEHHSPHRCQVPSGTSCQRRPRRRQGPPRRQGLRREGLKPLYPSSSFPLFLLLGWITVW